MELRLLLVTDPVSLQSKPVEGVGLDGVLALANSPNRQDSLQK
jgi:hypothetical protein